MHAPAGGPADDLSELEAAISDTWSWARATARAGARALDPAAGRDRVPAGVHDRLARRDAAVRALAALHLDKSTVSRQIDAAARLGLLERRRTRTMPGP